MKINVAPELVYFPYNRQLFLLYKFRITCRIIYGSKKNYSIGTKRLPICKSCCIGSRRSRTIMLLGDTLFLQRHATNGSRQEKQLRIFRTRGKSQRYIFFKQTANTYVHVYTHTQTYTHAFIYILYHIYFNKETFY